MVLTHLHNLVPLVFLWEWTRRIPHRGARAAFRLTQVLWIVVLPLVILAGGFDRIVADGPGIVQRFVGAGSAVVSAATPPALLQTMGIRFLVVFAFMQTMHYVVWVGFLPRFAPDATASYHAYLEFPVLLALLMAPALVMGAGGGGTRTSA